MIPFARWRLSECYGEHNGVVPLLPSVGCTLLMESAGWASSLTMVPVAWASGKDALLLMPLRLTKKFSLGSNLVSPLT